MPPHSIFLKIEKSVQHRQQGSIHPHTCILFKKPQIRDTVWRDELLSLVDCKVGNALIIFDVVGHQGKMMMESGCSNKQIVMVSRLSQVFGRFDGSEVHTKNRTPLSNGWVNPEHLYSAHEAVKHLCILRLMVPVVHPFIDSHVAHNAYGYALRKKCGNLSCRLFIAFEVVNHGVTIHQEVHSLTGGRLLVLRRSS